MDAQNYLSPQPLGHRLVSIFRAYNTWVQNMLSESTTAITPPMSPTKSATTLPPELCSAILDFLTTEPGKKGDLLSACLASRLLHQLVEPLLFSSILLTRDTGVGAVKTLRLLRILEARAEAREWVGSVTIRNRTSRPKDPEMYKTVAELFCKLHNLRSVRLRRVPILDTMMLHLMRQSHPFTLECSGIIT
jgi:hypothetical protein